MCFGRGKTGHGLSDRLVSRSAPEARGCDFGTISDIRTQIPQERNSDAYGSLQRHPQGCRSNTESGIRIRKENSVLKATRLRPVGFFSLNSGTLFPCASPKGRAHGNQGAKGRRPGAPKEPGVLDRKVSRFPCVKALI